MFKYKGYTFKFHHAIADDDQPFSHFTNCFVVNSLGAVTEFGVALCSRKDNFCRSTGRKVALANALEHLKWDKEARVGVWKAYFERDKDRTDNRKYA